jgi:hypothetical protein
MTDRAKFEQMLEYLINDEKAKAEELFHDLVVAKSREIYENLLDDDVKIDETDDEEDEDEEVDENFDLGIDEVGGDPADDMMSDIETDDDMDMGDEEGGDEPATKDDVMDIKDALEDLKAEFEALMGGEEQEGDMDMDDEEGDMDMDDEEEVKDDFQFETDDEDEEETDEGFVREYVEKVAPAKMGDNGANTRSPVAGKNDMGGTTANIAKGGTEAGVMANQGQLKGNGLLKGKPQDMKTGNINVPGGKAGNAFNKKEPGHGAEKKGSSEQAVNKTSIIGSK